METYFKKTEIYSILVLILAIIMFVISNIVNMRNIFEALKYTQEFTSLFSLLNLIPAIIRTSIIYVVIIITNLIILQKKKDKTTVVVLVSFSLAFITLQVGGSFSSLISNIILMIKGVIQNVNILLIITSTLILSAMLVLMINQLLPLLKTDKEETAN